MVGGYINGVELVVNFGISNVNWVRSFSLGESIDSFFVKVGVLNCMGDWVNV